MPGKPPELVILGWGNPSRGDDALGPLLCDRLEAWLPTSPVAGRVVVHQDFQLQVEHALDLVDCRLALFIDAAVDLPGPFRFAPPAPAAGAPTGSHALLPEQVLGVFAQIHGRAPPASWLLAVSGHRFALGAGLSRAAAAHLEAAWEFLQELCLHPEPPVWAVMAAARGRDAAG